MSVTLDKRILRTFIAVVGLIASGAVLAECPDPVGRWVGTFQTHEEGGTHYNEEVWALRLRADGTFKWRIMSYGADELYSGEGGVWFLETMTGSCMLQLDMRPAWSATVAYGPFVDKRTLKLMRYETPMNPEDKKSGLGTLHKVSF